MPVLGSRRRVARDGFALLASLGLLFACSAGDVVIGDDTTVSPVSTGNADGSITDGPPIIDGSTTDAQPDAAPGTCEAIGGVCQSASTTCSQRDTSGATCAMGGDYCCKTPCPTLSPPAPGSCDGGPTAPRYDLNGCVIGYACAPIVCAAAGGQCVALTPGSCASGRYGDATKYTCGPGLGTTCCLP